MKDTDNIKRAKAEGLLPKMGRPPTEHTVKIIDAILKEREKGVFVTGLVRAEGLSPSSVSTTLSRLERDGFLKHKRESGGGNVRKVFYVIESKIPALKMYREAVADTVQLAEVPDKNYKIIRANLPLKQQVIIFGALLLAVIAAFLAVSHLGRVVILQAESKQLQDQVEGLNNWLTKLATITNLENEQLELTSQEELDSLEYLPDSVLLLMHDLVVSGGNQPYDLEPVTQLVKLEKLELFEIEINEQSFTPLEGISLDVLKLNNLAISHAGVLKNLKTKEIHLSYVSIDDVRPLLSISGLEIARWSGGAPYNASLLSESGVKVFGVDGDFGMGTGSVSGVYLPIGKRASAIINSKANLNKPLNAKVTAGSIFNVRNVGVGTLDVGIAQSDVIHDYENSLEAVGFPLRILLGLHTEPLHLLCTKASGITRIQDIAGGNKRIELGQLDSGMTKTVYDVLRVLKIDRTFQSYGHTVDEAFKSLLSDDIDCIFYTVGIGAKPIREALDSGEVILIGLREADIKTITDEYPYYFSTSIPEDTYPNTESATPTIGVKAFLISNSRLPDKIACEIAKAIYENFEDLKQEENEIPALKALRQEDLKTIGEGEGLPPFHDGAEMAFEGKDCV